MRKLFGAVSVIVGTAFLWLGYSALQAQRNEVSLTVHDEDVHSVIRKIERQTWETILVRPNVQGRVTLNVRKAPLEAVLAVIAEQTSSRWSALYPLYSNKGSLEEFKKTVLGQILPGECSWTNFVEGQLVASASPFDANLRTQNRLISVHLDQKPLDVAAMSVSRFGQVQIVPEDGTRAVVSLKLSESTMNGAVRQLARQANRQWDKFYALMVDSPGQAARAPIDVPLRTIMASRTADSRPTNDGSLAPEIRDILERQLQSQSPPPSAIESPLSAEQNDELTQQSLGQIDIRRRQFEQRIMHAVKHTTPQQRLEWDRAVAEYRKNKEKDETK